MKAKPINDDSLNRLRHLLAEPEPDDSIQQAFLRFHTENPHVYEFLVRFAREAVRELESRGRARRYGIAACVERARWHVNFEIRGFSDFKLNNNMRSRYARMIMRRETDLFGVFELRELHDVEVNYAAIIQNVNNNNLVAQ